MEEESQDTAEKAEHILKFSQLSPDSLKPENQFTIEKMKNNHYKNEKQESNIPVSKLIEEIDIPDFLPDTIKENLEITEDNLSPDCVASDRQVVRERIRDIQVVAGRQVSVFSVVQKLQEIRELSEDGIMLLKVLKQEGSLPGAQPVLQTLSQAINKLLQGLKININFQEDLLSLCENSSIKPENLLKQELKESIETKEPVVTITEDEPQALSLTDEHSNDECGDDDPTVKNEVLDIKLENPDMPESEPKAKLEDDDYFTNDEVEKKTSSKKKKAEPKKKRNRKKGPVIPCEQCDRQFTCKSLFTEHMRRHLGERPFKCDQCLKAYGTKGTLKAHVEMVHEGEKPFKCDICPKSFYRKTDLERHKLLHTGEKPYKCEFCAMDFVTSSNLIKHVRCHTGEKPYICDICAKAFISSAGLKDHRRIHTGEKPYKCTHCGKCFRRSGHLGRHIRVHTGVRPYQCELCEKFFSRKENLREHMNTHSRIKSE